MSGDNEPTVRDMANAFLPDWQAFLRVLHIHPDQPLDQVQRLMDEERSWLTPIERVRERLNAQASAFKGGE